MEYQQNYDIILKWMTEVLCGQTLDFMGLKIGRIADVFGFEPVDIVVRAGRVDIIVRTESGDLFHIEEQRDLRKADLYRFASYHFQGARKWGDKLTDVIIASGDVYSGNKEISTSSGQYQPIVADLSGRDGWKRLEKIRAEVKENNYSSLLELVFIPLYGKEKGAERSELAFEVLAFATEQFKARKMELKFVAATFVIANKMISKEKLKELWEVIKMLDIVELAMEKGEEKGRLETAQEMILDTIYDLSGNLQIDIIDKVRSITHLEILKRIHRQALKCKSIDQFEEILEGVA